MKNLLPALALSAIVSLAITSCGGGDSSSTASTNSTTTTSASTGGITSPTTTKSGGAKVEFVSPKDGSTTGSQVEATLRLTGLADGQHNVVVTVTGADRTPEAQASSTFVVKSGP